MSPRVLTPATSRPRAAAPAALAAFAALAALAAACSPDSVVRPDRAQPARLVLATAGAPLASLGDSALVVPQVLDAAGVPLAGVPVRWSVRDTGVVRQDGAGVYRAVGNGRVTVVAEVDPGQTGVRPAGYYVGPVADSVVLEVRQRPARLALAPVDTAFGALDASRRLRVQVADARGNPMPDALAGLAWRSADPRVVSVDSAGVVRSVGEGAARVTVQADGLFGAATFTVRPRLAHTSCMVFAARRRTRQSCVTLDFTVRAREGAR
jgi:hypothetical protein